MPEERPQNPENQRRRPRYSGTHPKQFEQKYKERNQQKYPDVHQKLRAKGKTPAGTHVPVLVNEVMACLCPQPGEIVADCTLGYGAHALAFIKLIGEKGTLIGFDVDGIELEKTRRRFNGQKAKISLNHMNFAGISKVISQENIDGYDIIFADLGVSSMQIDDPSRGISYKNEGPLDMRMDHRLNRTGADMLKTLSEEELSQALWELSDEPDHEKIAQVIVGQRAVNPITQVSQLLRLILNVKGMTERTWKKKQKESGFGSLHPAARTFQTLRILVNDELASIKELLRVAPYCLRPGGRIGIISFHSGEDRIVKH
ncbi:MAG: 16S rRNA (cytosine(1402)-N(4))-methyltransferase RsmH, partial [Sedimentisphaerales bacterium]|nr:16S rRNA (cytosine(1402)-N(4))-methyltransferase RsmH [Sedimentisphaerales bacterium]